MNPRYRHLLTSAKMASPQRQISTHSSHHKSTKPNEKHPKFGNLPLSTSGPQDCALTGAALLNTPYFNKGAAFPAEERKQFKLTGLLPQNVQSLESQVKRAYQQFSSRQDDLAKNTFMTSLAEQNQVLYFRVSKSTFPCQFSVYSNIWINISSSPTRLSGHFVLISGI